MKKLVIIIFIIAIPLRILAQWEKTTLPVADAHYVTTFNDNLFAGGAIPFRSSDNGNNWMSLGSGMSGAGNYSILKVDSFLFAGTDGRGLYRSNDSGASWQSIPINFGIQFNYIWDLSASGSIVFALSQFVGVAMSSNSGDTWIEAVGLPQARVHTILPIGNSLFAATDSGLYVSGDSGKTWLKKNVLSNGISALVKLNDILYASSDRVYRSIDEGNSWIRMNVALSYLTIKDSFVFGIGTGVYRIGNGDTSWSQITTIQPDTIRVSSLAVNDSYIFIGSHAAGVWRYPLSELQVRDNALQKGIFIFPNYPNPISKQTTIHFTLDKSEFIDVNIFDLLGRQYGHLYSGEAEAGEHILKWDASDVISGSYFCNIQTVTNKAGIFLCVQH